MAQIGPIRNGFEPGPAVIDVELEDALHLFGRQHMLENGTIMGAARKALDGHVLGHEHLVDEIRDGHRVGLGSAVMVLPRGQLLPDDPLRLFPGHAQGADGGSDVDGLSPAMLLEAAHIEQILVDSELPGAVLPIEIHVIWKSSPIHCLSNGANVRRPRRVVRAIMPVNSIPRICPQ